MNTARYATEILQAWQFGDLKDLRIALARTSHILRRVRSISSLDQEREEMLHSLVHELDQLDRQGSIPPFSEASAAAVLLEHLQSFPFLEDDTTGDQTDSHPVFAPVSA